MERALTYYLDYIKMGVGAYANRVHQALFNWVQFPTAMMMNFAVGHPNAKDRDYNSVFGKRHNAYTVLCSTG